MYLKYYFIIFYLLINSVFAQSNHTILTYNLLNYEDEDDREGYYQLIIDEIQPDIIVCQEVNAGDGFNHFLNDVLNIVHDAVEINSVKIYNLNGQEVFNSIVNAKQVKLNTSDIANGLYIIEIKSNNITTKSKLSIK